MKIDLKKSIVFFDIESTGLHVIRDRIIQIAMIKYNEDGSQEEFNQLINPGIPIGEEALSVVSIRPEDLKNKPTFAQVGQKIFDFIGDSDLGGYAMNRLDIPILIEEFGRIGLDFEIKNRSLIDAQRIFYKMEPRTLSAAMKFYTNTPLVNAHDAMADVKATIAVLNGQLEKYQGVDFEEKSGEILESPIRPDAKSLHQFTNDTNQIDPTQRLKYDNDGNIVFNFGKYNGQLVGQTLFKDRNYLNWLLEKEFSYQVKKIVKKEFDAEVKRRKK